MSGILKTKIGSRILEAIACTSDVRVLAARFSSGRSKLPFLIEVQFPRCQTRQFALYFWSISHGGRTRADDEYRIQLKLEGQRELQVGGPTTLLMGYYQASADRVGRAIGNSPPDDMELFAAWDPIEHLFLGSSSSCQLKLGTMLASHTSGLASSLRRCADGGIETVYCFRPELLARYLYCARAGHRHITEPLI